MKEIDVSKVINKENMLLWDTSAQNFEVGQLVVVVLEKFFIVGPFRSPPQPEPLILFIFMNPSTPGTSSFNILMVWFTGPKSPVWSSGGGQKCHNWNAHLIFFHHDGWKFDGIKILQSSSFICFFSIFHIVTCEIFKVSSHSIQIPQTVLGKVAVFVSFCTLAIWTAVPAWARL